MLKRKKPTKALEKAARLVKDSDDFVEHVGNIAERYRREHVLAAGSRSSDVRKALREFQKHASVLTQWLHNAHKVNQLVAEHEALNKIGAALYGVPSLAHTESKPVHVWLAEAEKAALRCVGDVKLWPRKPQPTAPRIAAEALRATFEHHKLKWSAVLTKQKQSDAIQLLCAVAKSAGDVAMTPELARNALRGLATAST